MTPKSPLKVFEPFKSVYMNSEPLSAALVNKSTFRHLNMHEADKESPCGHRESPFGQPDILSI